MSQIELKTIKQQVNFIDFIEFILKPTKSKMVVVKKAKYRSDYHPSTDYYKRLRSQLVKTHKQNQPITSINVEELVAGLKDFHRKHTAFEELISHYAKWLDGKTITYFKPEKGYFDIGPLNLYTSANIGLIIDGTPYLIRLHFSKGKSMDPIKASLITYFMRQGITKCPENCIMAVLDIRKGIFYEETPVSQGVVEHLDMLAEQWLKLWEEA